MGEDPWTTEFLPEHNLLHIQGNDQHSYRSPKVLNVLEFYFSILVPSNVLEFHCMFLDVHE